jgi:hypothetical protein
MIKVAVLMDIKMDSTRPLVSEDYDLNIKYITKY